MSSTSVNLKLLHTVSVVFIHFKAWLLRLDPLGIIPASYWTFLTLTTMPLGRRGPVELRMPEEEQTLTTPLFSSKF